MNSSVAGTPLSPLGSDSSGLQNKKRKAGSSGRGVSSLTPEQLAKKRANDREAQRAIRERTKATIETLEHKIQQLESQQPYQELQAIIRQKDALQAENEEIRRRLASIMSIIQPVVGAQGLTDLATAAQHNVQMGFGQPSNNVFQQSDQYLQNSHRPYQSHSPGLSSPQDAAYSQAFANGDQDTSTENRVWTSSRDALNQQRDNLHRGLELNDSGERLNFNFLLDASNQKHMQVPNVPSSLATSPHSRSSYPTTVFSDQVQPVWTMLPKNCAPTCPLDNILLNFLQARQRESNSGATIHSPAYPSVSSLLNPASSRNHNIDPISQLMTDIIGKFPNIAQLPEQVATLFFMFLYMRWQIYPTQENYERLPEWLTPRPSQLFTSHPAWIDHLPFPRMRDRLVHNHQDFPFENWFLPFTSGLCVNWPYEPVDCLLSTGESSSSSSNNNLHGGHNSSHTKPPQSSQHQHQQSTTSSPSTSSKNKSSAAAAAAAEAAATTTMNPVFERHIRRLDNWTLGQQFLDSYPNMADTANFLRDVRNNSTTTTTTTTTTNIANNAGVGGGGQRGVGRGGGGGGGDS